MNEATARATTSGEKAPSVRTAALRLVILAAVIGIAALLLHWTGAFSSATRLVRELRALRGHAWLAPAFALAYAALASVAFPGEVLTLAGGVLFGVGLGSLLNWIGATLGACGAYALARGIAGHSAERLVGKRVDLLHRIREGDSAFWTLLRLRLIPLVPFNLLNVASGVARVAFRPYLLATAFGIVPAMIVYTYFADSLTSGLAGAKQHALVNLAIAAALLIALSFVPALVKQRGRR